MAYGFAAGLRSGGDFSVGRDCACAWRQQLRAALLAWSAGGSAALAQGTGPCPNPNALGVSRTVEIDTTGGPGFGFEHYKAHDFLRLKEVVLTFDDGPQVGHTQAILDALAAPLHQGDVLLHRQDGGLGLPEIIRDVHKARPYHRHPYLVARSI